MSQKTILKIVQQLAPVINLPVPTVVTTSADGTVLRLTEMVKAVCDDLLSEYDWEMLQTRYVFSTVSGQAAYPFPGTIDRWISGSFFDSTRRWELQGPLTAAQWEQLLTTNISSTPYQRYRVFGNSVQFYPTPGVTPYTFVYEYISNAYVTDGTTGVAKSDFTQDSDVCKFDHRLVIYGTKVKWLQSIGHDTSAALNEFERALQFQKGHDTPSAILDARGTAGNLLISASNIRDGSWS